MKFKKTMITISLAASLILAGCSNTSQTEAPEPPKEEVAASELPSENNSETEEAAQADTDVVYSADELKDKSVNELGLVMVLMYHSVDYPEATWTRTPENLRKDLETLYEKGYRAISLNDYAGGNITTEIGYTPVVITFDDGNENNFKTISENGEKKIDPKCAIGVLEKFKEDHPDFNMTATFFLNGNPFNNEDVEYKLKYLVENGYDIGNHTYNHLSLGKSDISDGVKNLALQKKMINKYLPDYEVNTLALPFGERPKDENLYAKIKESSYEGTSYKNDAILLVGWDPYKSPYHVKFDPHNIHRVRASEMNVDDVGIYNWLEYFDQGKKTRYISDGNPDTVVAPERFKEVANEAENLDKTFIFY